MPFAALHESAVGTKQTYRGARYFVRFRSNADMGRRIASIIFAAFDPERALRGLKSRTAASH
jgi:hypothetical protein